MKVDFYNFQKIPFDTGLFKVVEKAYNSGDKILIKTNDTARQDYLDKLLWEYEAISWLPHGITKACEQPIFISLNTEPENKATILIITDSSPIPQESIYTRCLYLFNGNDKVALDKARQQYKELLEKKSELQYHNL